MKAPVNIQEVEMDQGRQIWPCKAPYLLQSFIPPVQIYMSMF